VRVGDELVATSALVYTTRQQYGEVAPTPREGGGEVEARILPHFAQPPPVSLPPKWIAVSETMLYGVLCSSSSNFLPRPHPNPPSWGDRFFFKPSFYVALFPAPSCVNPRLCPIPLRRPLFFATWAGMRQREGGNRTKDSHSCHTAMSTPAFRKPHHRLH